MSQTKVTKSKGEQERPKLKVMHHLDKDGNGNATITSTISNPPKLREAVGPDVVQQAEEMGHKTVQPAKVEKAKDEITELDRKILHALDALGGKDIASIDMAKKVGTVKTHPDAPRAPIRRAMEAFEKLGYVKAEKKGAKYLFSITEKGKHALANPAPKHQDSKDKGANPAPASTASTESIRPPNTNIECPKCHASNPFHAEYCKEYGTILRQRAETVLKAAPTAA